jgi:hypothetical protein
MLVRQKKSLKRLASQLKGSLKQLQALKGLMEDLKK